MAVTPWMLFDELTRKAQIANPWKPAGDRLVFEPDFALLGRLLAVPLHLNATTQSGVPAKAFDVWVAHEFRRAGFTGDAVWPRARRPRVLPREVALLLGHVPAGQRSELERRLSSGMAGVSGSDARILGKNYIKQVDVVIAEWQRGPELLVSTKRMDASFSNNALNRVEESYGDAKNLRGRHPLAALGYLFSLRSTAWDQVPAVAERIVDLLVKLGREDDAYDATALVVPRYDLPSGSAGVEEPDETADPGEGDGAVTAPAAAEVDPAMPDADSTELQRQLDRLPPVGFLHDKVPEGLQPARFFQRLIERMLGLTPVELHTDARRLRAEAAGSERLVDGTT
jgi:hypothetical protein